MSRRIPPVRYGAAFVAPWQLGLVDHDGSTTDLGRRLVAVVAKCIVVDDVFVIELALAVDRANTFMMIDADVVVASPSSVYRVLKQANLLSR